MITSTNQTKENKMNITKYCDEEIYENSLEHLLEFSHYCANVIINNVNLEAFYKSGTELRIFRFTTDAVGNKTNIESIDILSEDYDNLDCDNYDNIVRFNAVNDLFSE